MSTPYANRTAGERIANRVLVSDFRRASETRAKNKMLREAITEALVKELESLAADDGTICGWKPRNFASYLVQPVIRAIKQQRAQP